MKRLVRLPLLWLLLVVLTLAILFPLIWLFLTSAKPPVEMFTVPPQLPQSLTLEHYLGLFGQRSLVQCFGNSVIISLCATIIAVVLGSAAAYAFARYSDVSNRALFLFFLVVRMMPAVIIVLALFRVYSSLGMLDTKRVMIITYVGYELPFVVWLMRSFIVTVPQELEEAGFIDGCSVLGVMTRIVMPLVLPGLAVTTILTFISVWNEFLFALVFTRTEVAKTVPVLIAGFITSRQMFWGLLSAAGTIFTLPVLVFTLFVQRYIVRGLTLGALKG